MPFRIVTILAASASAMFPTLAQAAQNTCLTRDEAGALFSYTLPQVINGTTKRCEQALPANSYLRKHGSELASQYSAQKQRHWPQAKAAFLKMSDRQGSDVSTFARALPDTALQPIVDATVEGLVAQNLPLNACERVDLAIDLLSPLPPENAAGIIAFLIELTATANDAAPDNLRDKANIAGFTLCKD